MKINNNKKSRFTFTPMHIGVNPQNERGFALTPKFFGVSSQGKRGFTIIETMIAVSIFSIIVIIGMSSLLNVGLISNKSKDMRSIMDSLSFTMEDISRNLRTGYDYHCVDDGNFTIVNPYSCPNANGGTGISFKPSSGGQWVYRIYNGSIQKSVDGGAVGSFIELTPPGVKINFLSSFTVFGAEPLPGDTYQPFVMIRLSGTITSKDNIVTPFFLQTGVSQRLIDITP